MNYTMTYTLEYYERLFTDDMIRKMETYNQKIQSISPLEVCDTFMGYSFCMSTQSEDDAISYLKSVGAILDKFNNVWKVDF